MKGAVLARPNPQFEKRQREMAKKKKQEEKRQRKLEKSAGTDESATPETAEGTPPEEPAE